MTRNFEDCSRKLDLSGSEFASDEQSEEEPDLINELQNIISELKDVIKLLKQKNQVRESKTIKRSKFVNAEDREKVLKYVQDPKIKSQITSQPKHKQTSSLQKQIHDDLGILISSYMAGKLIRTFMI